MDKTREICVSKLKNILNKKTLSKKIEEEIYNYILKISIEKNITQSFENYQFKRLYVNKAREIVDNLNTSSYINNTYLRDKVISQDIEIKKIPHLTREQIFPQNWAELQEQKHKLDDLKYNITEQATTDEFQCKRCFERNYICYLCSLSE